MNQIYPVNEIFATIQGEGTCTGRPSIFIRFQGCDVGCGWCDTKHTWKLDPKQQDSYVNIINKVAASEKYTLLSTKQIIDLIKDKFHHITNVVLTGGEPALHNLQELCETLENIGKKIHIETSGTAKLFISKKTWVVLSPKFDMPGGKTIIIDNLPLVNEIKMPIGKQYDLDKLMDFIDQYKQHLNDIEICLQPISNNLSATKLCIDAAIANNFRLSLQVHKFINLR